MASDNNRGNDTHQQSQDALRHEKDALHHKFHNAPPDQAVEKGEPVEQPEIPKVGSRDAPGG